MGVKGPRLSYKTADFSISKVTHPSNFVEKKLSFLYLMFGQGRSRTACSECFGVSRSLLAARSPGGFDFFQFNLITQGIVRLRKVSKLLVGILTLKDCMSGHRFTSSSTIGGLFHAALLRSFTDLAAPPASCQLPGECHYFCCRSC